MSLSLYNTLTRKKEPFQPIDPTSVRMYVCGPTVYDLAHIGNARPIIVFDVLFRLLRHIYGEAHVSYARNITDVDDKINNRAVERWPDMDPIAAIGKLTAETTAQFHKDIAALGVLMPEDVNRPGQPPVFVEPRATEHIEGMRALCEALVAKGHAYVAEEHVLFDASSMKDYGRLANRSLEEMEAGARVDVAPYKKGPMDFVLWKPSTAAQPGWLSPCGIKTPGRPGWHIECSAMAKQHLGEVFDIHGGGIDLVFPHHENEIAQSRSAHGTPVMANVWMHNGFLQVEGEKMSKSLGNFVTIKELLDSKRFGKRRWSGEVLRLAMLMTNYREPINWSFSRLKEAEKELWSWIKNYWANVSQDFYTRLYVKEQRGAPDEKMISALQDDLNTPEMLTRLRQLNTQAASGVEEAAQDLALSLIWLGLYRPEYHQAYGDGLIGSSGTADSAGKAPPIYLLARHTDAFREAKTIVLNEYVRGAREPSDRERSRKAVEDKINAVHPELEKDGVKIRLSEHCDLDLIYSRPPSPSSQSSDTKIERLIAARLEARRAKDYKESDRIRDELAAMGIALKDSKNKDTGEIETTWEVRASGTTEVKR